MVVKRHRDPSRRLCVPLPLLCFYESLSQCLESNMHYWTAVSAVVCLGFLICMPIRVPSISSGKNRLYFFALFWRRRGYIKSPRRPGWKRFDWRKGNSKSTHEALSGVSVGCEACEVEVGSRGRQWSHAPGSAPNWCCCCKRFCIWFLYLVRLDD